MRYYSTNRRSQPVGLRDAVIECMASDGGLYLPERLPCFPHAFIDNMAAKSLREIAYVVTDMFMAGDVASETLKTIVDETLSFDVPFKEIAPGRYALELFHGPTMAFKDIGVRFMARLLSSMDKKNGVTLKVFVATSGNTGAAVASGFSDIDNIEVYILYPKGGLSAMAEKQIASAADNIVPIEVAGNIDQCRNMVSTVLSDVKMREHFLMTSANSLNIARLMPQVSLFYYAVSRLIAAGINPSEVDFAIPSGNLSLVTAGAMAALSGLKTGRLIAACNANNATDRYLRASDMSRHPIIRTIAPCMDTVFPSNLPRLQALFADDIDRLRSVIDSVTIGDEMIKASMLKALGEGYLTDPHTSVGLSALDCRVDRQRPGLVFATAHPAKSADTIYSITSQKVETARLLKSFHPRRVPEKMAPTFPALRKFLLRDK